jgi:hypothetical protein
LANSGLTVVNYQGAQTVQTTGTQWLKRNHDIIEIAGELRNKTEKAYQFYDGSKTVWIPKSQAEWDDHSQSMQMPEWLAMERGLI